MKKNIFIAALSLLTVLYFSARPLHAEKTKGKIYLAVLYYGQISLVIDFSSEKMGLMAVLDEIGKWDLQIKDPQNAEVKFVNLKKIPEYMHKTFEGKISKIGDIKIDRYAVDHPVLMGQPRTIGGIPIKYYDKSENKAGYGKVMRIGNTILRYHAYQTLPYYGKLSHIGKIRIEYFKKDIKGIPLAGKVSKIGKLKVIYNDQGEITGFQGTEPGFEIEFWDKKKLNSMEEQAVKEEELEKKVDALFDEEE